MSELKSILQKAGIRSAGPVPVDIPDLDSDVDVIGSSDNVVLLIECVGKADFGEKIKTTITKHDAIESNFDKFLEEVKSQHSEFYEASKGGLTSEWRVVKHIVVTFVKETIEEIDKKHRQLCDEKKFFVWTLDQKFYFDKVADCTFDHCRYEIYDALGIEPPQVKSETPEPDVHPFVAHGYSRQLDGGARVYLLNFVVGVETLLNRSKISRLAEASTKVGYQRLLDKDKLRRMRKYLLKGVPIYPNNIICILDPKSGVIPFTKVIKDDLVLTDDHKAKTDLVNKSIREDTFLVELPDTYRALEIIDGQHRLFSYAQSRYGDFEKTKTSGEKTELAEGDKKIRELAGNSYLNVTAVHSKGEWGNPGKLFLEINTTQTRIKPEDVIDLMAKYQEYRDDPKVSANRLLLQMNGRREGILSNKIKRKWWQSDKIKRTSLISYSGLEAVFKVGKRNKTYGIFNNAFELQKEVEPDYVNFCEAMIESFILTLSDLVKAKVGKEEFKKISRDVGLQDYYLYSAVYVGTLVRLLRHFLTDKDKRFGILPKLKVAMAEWKSVAEDPEKYGNPNMRLEPLFSPGLKVIAEKFDFTRAEFDKNGWASNRWPAIEAELYYLIRGKKDDFGDEMLIKKGLRRNAKT